MQAVSVYALWSLLRSSDSICVRACMHSRCVFISATAPIQRSVRYRYELGTITARRTVTRRRIAKGWKPKIRPGSLRSSNECEDSTSLGHLEAARPRV